MKYNELIVLSAAVLYLTNFIYRNVKKHIWIKTTEHSYNEEMKGMPSRERRKYIHITVKYIVKRWHLCSNKINIPIWRGRKKYYRVDCDDEFGYNKIEINKKEYNRAKNKERQKQEEEINKPIRDFTEQVIKGYNMKL
jgi:hypothetical protein